MQFYGATGGGWQGLSRPEALAVPEGVDDTPEQPTEDAGETFTVIDFEDASPFAVDPVTGEVTVQNPGLVVWWYRDPVPTHDRGPE